MPGHIFYIKAEKKKKKKNIISLSSADFAQRVVKIKLFLLLKGDNFCDFLFFFPYKPSPSWKKSTPNSFWSK